MKKKGNAAFRKFIRKTKRNLGMISKHRGCMSNNDLKRRHQTMWKRCYWKCKDKEVYGKEL